MILTDKIYGTFSITDPVVVELIEAPSFQRLKGVWQNGMPPRYLGANLRKWSYTRYDHSIGVFLLLRKLGAAREEQIAGLLHDVSHMAFSHAYDWIMEDYQTSDKHVNSQDARHEEYVKSTELYAILEKHGLAADKVIHHTQYALLDIEVPGICVDRLDYCLRELTKEAASKYVSSLTVHGSQIIFRDKDIASDFAKLFITSNRDNWASYESASRFHILARTMRYALQKGYVVPQDFAQTDDNILAKIESKTDDEYIKQNILLLSSDALPTVGPHLTVRTKFRYVDPLFWRSGKIIRLSEDDVEFAKMVEVQRQIFTAPIEVFDGE